MAKAAQGVQRKRAIQRGPEPPRSRPHAGPHDVRKQFAALSAKQPTDENFRTAFIQSKIALMHTHPAFDVTAREQAVRSISKRLGAAAPRALKRLIAVGSTQPDQPVPGGVGYGLFYKPPFQTGWGRGTSITFDIVCPTPPGGNVNTWLYLTATNRASMGVEAFISYNGQNDTHFRIFDWARSDQWQTDIPLSGLADYLTTQSAHGHPYQVLPVWNSTWRISDTTFRNEVLLYNRTRGGWDLVYQYDYAATDAQQRTTSVGTWGPIVETFQPLYSKTNAMGALQTQLRSADSNGTWGDWTLLSNSNSDVRVDNEGFQLVFLDPNSAFIVIS